MCSMQTKVMNDPMYHEDLQITVQIRLIYKLRLHLLPILTNCDGNVNFIDKEGQTVLHVFFRYYVQDSMSASQMSKCLKLVQRLIKLGVSIDSMDNQKHTPLHIAVKYKNYKADLVCQPWLLISNFTRKPAYESDWLTILNLLIPKNYDLNTEDYDGYTLLHHAVENGAISVVSKLIQLGANVNCRTKRKRLTPLHLVPTEKFYRPYKNAHSFGNFYSNDIELLLAAGADINAEAADGVTPLLRIVVYGDVKDVRYMINRGANFLHPDQVFGFTPFHLASHDSMKLQLMLERISSDVHQPTNRGITPLHVASILGNVDAVDLLIRHGADVNCCTEKYKLTPLHLAVMNDSEIPKLESLVGVIGRRQAETSSLYELWNSLTFNRDRADLIELLVNRGANENAVDVFGRTPLFLASRCPTNCALSILLKLGADLNVEDHKGRLPLHNVIRNKNAKGFKHLLKYGANINDPDVYHNVVNAHGEIKHIALKFAIKLQAADLPIAKDYEVHLNKQIYRYHFSKCLDEVEELKIYKINDVLSVYDLLHASLKSQFIFTKRKRIPDDFSVKFPMYCGIIRTIYNESKKKLSLMVRAKFAWYQTTQLYLPDLCVENILSYLNSKHLNILITGKRM
ncbi:serine/threonine-protein phosphatase 6 regulatory ankyrin repeat subunit C-like isoform X2 [Phymastichus coffea]|uniref:serine/threonine-protein phosphatase 6 regulatory ankyrin repeat subunit C-like isoform X2 n=1 Tax=Phymastichus coffea TaxID=108790 RepID=UPI00273BD8E3|nr:serine/threonine-protein phosphatase 6 regulatory ankyrin repeat subunit C-like isoform X2 [Phymastichus coffea]